MLNTIITIITALISLLSSSGTSVPQLSEVQKKYYVDRLEEVEKVCDFEYEGLFYEFADGDNVTLVRDKSIFVDYNREVPFERIWELACDRKDNLCYTGDLVVPDSVEYDGKKYRVAYINTYALSMCKGLRSLTFSSPFRAQEANEGTHICCFTYNPDLEQIVFPDDMTEISYQVYMCPSLTDIRLPSALTYLESSLRYIGASEVDFGMYSSTKPSRFYIDNQGLAFNGDLLRVKMPECDTICFNGFNFRECPKANQIVFRSCSTIELMRVDFLRNPMLSGSKSMKVVSESLVPPEVIIYDNTGMEGYFDQSFRAQAVLYVPDESMGAYSEAYYWKDFGEIRPMSEYLREENAGVDVPLVDESADARISLSSDRGELRIAAAAPAEVTVWSLQGLPLWSGTVTDEVSVTLPRGVYIVTTPGSSRKYRH